MPDKQLTTAKKKIEAAKKAKPTNKREWQRVINAATSVLKSAGIKV
jgi:hypothetical protein